MNTSKYNKLVNFSTAKFSSNKMGSVIKVIPVSHAMKRATQKNLSISVVNHCNK